jgi:hypothetical protein
MENLSSHTEKKILITTQMEYRLVDMYSMVQHLHFGADFVIYVHLLSSRFIIVSLQDVGVPKILFLSLMNGKKHIQKNYGVGILKENMSEHLPVI